MITFENRDELSHAIYDAWLNGCCIGVEPVVDLFGRAGLAALATLAADQIWDSSQAKRNTQPYPKKGKST